MNECRDHHTKRKINIIWYCFFVESFFKKNLQKIQMKLFPKQKETHRQKKSKFMATKGKREVVQFSSVQFLRCVQLFVTPWTVACQASLSITNSRSPPQQTHVHWVGDAIQPSHPLLSSSPPVLSLSQHQGLLIWVSSLHQVAKVLEFQLQHQSFQRRLRTDLL